MGKFPSENTEKKKKIIGSRIRVGIGDNIHFEDDEEVKVLGEDTTLIVSSEDATEAEIIGKEIRVQVGPFNSIFKQINEREDLGSQTKKELEARVKELEEELMKKPPNKNKIDRLMSWFKKNASWLLPIISQILSKLP